ncbi:glycerol kinase GlpK [Rhizobium sp. SSA_523]|uniref:glycerol kinase GlpK n=1 Tax=Rhizobium sp. SSA_523 TaxID=2952477 RepID=UPI0020902AD8|nr:glycerol kinase GlpK [Rhizobium sp. SSA_523]MCO5732546.1 glycerol kinase GlpK [Rhizobium sp. SSA_523]WKC22316.1 glycerol kinase GlpK [Rhizobium sp. SSA_523]
MKDFILAIDQGTTSTRSIIFDRAYQSRGVGQMEFTQHFPQSGWVEHEADDLWTSTVETARKAIAAAGVTAQQIAALGITNQRETALVWDRRSGKAIHRAIVWQDRRTSDHCARLRAEGHSDIVAERTGLLIDPYFSATKIAWLLDNVEGAREAAQAGHLAFGTVDSWLIYKLTGGKRHVIDVTNASRTMLCNIGTVAWDDELLSLFDIPRSMMPEILSNIDAFGETDPEIFGASIAIRGVAGDQQAAVIGQACFTPGMMKSTYGTGCFALLNTGADRVASKNRLLTTIAYRLGNDTHYALEGSIFIAGAAVQWLRDGLKMIGKASETAELAAKADPGQRVYLVPAFTGLGAPWWDAEARGAMFGMTRNTGPAEFARAALESVCFQTHDLLGAMRKDWPGPADTLLRVDGGMSANDWTMQRLADILGIAVDRSASAEVTALGAAWLAGHGAGIWPDRAGFAADWHREREFSPTMNSGERSALLKGWDSAVKCTLAFGK